MPPTAARQLIRRVSCPGVPSSTVTRRGLAPASEHSAASPSSSISCSPGVTSRSRRVALLPIGWPSPSRATTYPSGSTRAPVVTVVISREAAAGSLGVSPQAHRAARQRVRWTRRIGVSSVGMGRLARSRVRAYMVGAAGQQPVSFRSTGPMLRLTTFGGLTLARGAEDLTGAATQRRRLALLVLLAVAGAPGMSPDKLLAYLWPESDIERARHVLNQLLYAQRQQVGDDLFLGRKTLRLNPALIATDVGAFEEACAVGDLGTAAGLYAGPFLDGFFVKEA